MDNKSKQTIDTIWKKYKRTLTLLAQALDELEKKPREVIVNKPTPQTLEEIAATNDHLQKQINENRKTVTHTASKVNGIISEISQMKVYK